MHFATIHLERTAKNSGAPSSGVGLGTKVSKAFPTVQADAAMTALMSDVSDSDHIQLQMEIDKIKAEGLSKVALAADEL